MRSTVDGSPGGRPESLADLLGGRRGAVDATLPPVMFVAGWLVAGGSVGAGALAAVVMAAALTLWRRHRGQRPRAVLLGLLGTCVAAAVAMRTGHAADFFLLQLLSNAASGLAWATSIVV